jgi:DEAD/DEAH box helicase domain-containing protein
LALDMARLAISPAAIIDLTSQWGTTTNPWTMIVSAANASAPATLQRLGYGAPVQFGILRGYINPTRKTLLVERHPLWQDEHPEWIAAQADARAKHPGYDPQPMNPFRLLRRPADYV